jgi:hypothetical protein
MGVAPMTGAEPTVTITKPDSPFENELTANGRTGMVTAVKTPTIAERVTRDLNTSLNHGVYPPGTRLPGG